MKKLFLLLFLLASIIFIGCSEATVDVRDMSTEKIILEAERLIIEVDLNTDLVDVLLQMAKDSNEETKRLHARGVELYGSESAFPEEYRAKIVKLIGEQTNLIEQVNNTHVIVKRDLAQMKIYSIELKRRAAELRRETA